MELLLQKPGHNYKAELQDYSQKKYQKPPEYKVLKASGPEHQKIFCIEVYLEGEAIATGEGESKKAAQQAAAANALTLLKI